MANTERRCKGLSLRGWVHGTAWTGQWQLQLQLQSVTSHPLRSEILDDAEGELRVLISNEVHSLFHCFTASLTHSFTASLCLCLQLHQPVLAVIDQPFRSTEVTELIVMSDTTDTTSSE